MRSCFQYYKQQLILKQLKKYNIKVAGLCETGVYDSGVKKISEHTLIYSELPSINKTRNAHGIAVILDKETSQIWQQSGAE